MKMTIGCALISVAFALTTGPTSLAQCSEWDDRFDLRGLNENVRAMTEFDDGTGPALYIGGNFTIAGDAPASYVAKWDGAAFTSVGGGVADGLNFTTVFALEVWDDGSGAALYAGGNFTKAGSTTVTGLARWDGTSWSAVGGSLTGGDAINPTQVRALEVYDDGSGSALFVGGWFTSAGGVPANRIAKWDGSAFAPLGSGAISYIQDMAVFDDGSGPLLYVSGGFHTGPPPLNLITEQIRNWNGSTWTVIPTPNARAFALEVYDDGTGDALYAGGEFAHVNFVANTNRIAKWDGSNWSSLGHGIEPGATWVQSLAVFDDGVQSRLVIGGKFANPGGAVTNNVAAWDGTSWSTFGVGADDVVHSLGSFDSGAGPTLYAGGLFDHAGGDLAEHMASWRAGDWSELTDGDGIPAHESLGAESLAVFDDGDGAALYAGGHFLYAGGQTVNGIAMWDGVSWSPLGGGVIPNCEPSCPHDVWAMTVFDDGLGPKLYAGGGFKQAGSVVTFNIAKWDGASWTSLTPSGGNGGGVGGGNSTVRCLQVFDDGSGSALYAGGWFGAIGSLTVNSIARWNGTSWSALGSGVGGVPPAATVHAIAIFDDGSGPALFVGGDFLTAGSSSANRIAKWDGASWSALGSGMNGEVRALAVFDDGSGPALYAGGLFTTAGGASANHVAKWNRTTWSSVSTGMDDDVLTLAVLDRGTGPLLHAGGPFTVAGGTSVHAIAAWDGTSWSDVEGGVKNGGSDEPASVRALVLHDDGADGIADLYVAGLFEIAGGEKVSRNIAKLEGCGPGVAYCFGDGIDSVVTTACPCSNFGGEGRGCANSNPALGGARLLASGSTNPNTLVFTCDGMPNNTFCTFLRSNASLDTGFVFGDGVKCLNGTGIRFGSQNAGQNGNPANTVSSTTASFPSGTTRYYQLQYRNPNAGFCPPELFNISNGYRVIW